jgi:sigma-E factor negative regulatory protein RseB
VTCYLPRSKTVLIDKGRSRRFPTLLPAQVDGITHNYDLHAGVVRRVAGHHCKTIRLTPKDKLRYGHKFCVEVDSGLPLAARMYDENGKLIELFAFSSIKIGGITRDMLKSKYAAVSGDWKVDRSGLSEHEVKGDGAWRVKDRPAGFDRLAEVRRMIAGQPQPVTHIVFSDGLAAVSVFIEPLSANEPRTGQSQQGAVNIVTRPVAHHLVTVMGEVPIVTIMQIANSLAFKGQ